MAVDKKDQTLSLLAEIDTMFDVALSGVRMPAAAKQKLREVILGAAFAEIDELVAKSRSPRMYVLGRSGHGKSSLLNALADKEVVQVGDIQPTTAVAAQVRVEFPESGSSWELIDSRGIFESTRPDGASSQNPLEQVKEDVRRYKPDVILHVIAAPEVRNLENDMKAYREICSTIMREASVPTVVVLNKIDTVGGRMDWPPEASPAKARLIEDLISYTSNMLALSGDPIDDRYYFNGLKTTDRGYLGVIPVCSYPSDRWNLETLSMFIGEHLPKSAQLAFYQGQRRKALLRSVATGLTKRFAAIAGMIGSTPTPFVDHIVLAPIQLLLVACIGGLSSRPFSITTAKEFLAAGGIAVGTLQAVGWLRGFVELGLPGIGLVISGSVASANMYGIGKAAEAYFFSGEVRKPSEFKMA